MFSSRTVNRKSKILSKAKDYAISRSSPFWDCNFTKSEIKLFFLVTLMAITQHLAPVLHSGLGTILVYILAATSYLSPATGFFFIACSQFLPFPEGSPHNPAQAGVLVWLPVVLLRYGRVNLTSIGNLWPVFPWLIWHMAVTGEMVFLPSGDYFKCLVYCVIACQLSNESKGRYLKCLVGLCFGALLVMSAYWASQLGLPVEVSDWGGDREGFARMGGARADSVMVWPALLFGISGMLGVQVAFASKHAPNSSPKWLTQATIMLTLASLPPLVSTMCHGAFAGLVLVVFALVAAIASVARNGAMANPQFRQLINWCCIAIVGVVLMFALDAFQMRTKTLALDKYHKQQSEELGGSTASRTGVWHDSINTILSYPVFGIKFSGNQEVITSEYAEQGWYLSHNIFLDFGRASGIPGMFFLALFFFWPTILILRTGPQERYIPFLLAHFAMLIFWMSLSFTFYKTFWGLWMLMQMTIYAGSLQSKTSLQENAHAKIIGKSRRCPTHVEVPKVKTD